MRETKFKGRIWVITDKSGKLIEDIDTDQIYHNAYLHITDIKEMGKYAFGNLEGWEDFPRKARPGDILFVGRNFGAGSSRQHAVDCFKALGISAIVGESFGAIYKRNAINSGMPLIEFPGLSKLVEDGKFQSGDEVEIDFLTGKIRNLTKNFEVQAKKPSKVQIDIYLAGDIFKYGRAIAKN